MLNRIAPRRPVDGEAELRYLDGDYRIVKPGAYVRCAVTDRKIPLDDLKYWSVERQEAYAGLEEVLARLHPARVKASPAG